MVSPVSSFNKTDRHDIPEILLKVALNTIKNDYSQTCINRSLNTGDLLKEFQFIWNCLWQEKTNVTL